MGKLHIKVEFDKDADRASVEMAAVGTPHEMMAALAAATRNLTERMLIAAPGKYALRLAEDIRDSQMRAVAEGALKAAETLEKHAGGKP